MKIRTIVAVILSLTSFCLGPQIEAFAQCPNSPPPAASPSSVEQFVERIYHRGYPFEEALEYAKGKDSNIKQRIDTLTCLLKVGTKKSYWSNIVTTLGVIGHPTAVEAMIEFVSRPIPSSNSIDWPLVRSKRSALIALGYVIKRHEEARNKHTDSEEKTAANNAVEFLCDHLEEKDSCTSDQNKLVAAKRKTIGKYRAIKSKFEIEIIAPYLRQAAILGLALSGSQEGGNALRELEDPWIVKFWTEYVVVPVKNAKNAVSRNISEFAPFSVTEALSMTPLFDEDENTPSPQKRKKQLIPPRVVDPIEEATLAHEIISQNKKGLECYYDSSKCDTQ
ncbi:MAG: hypothetical protein MRJ96_05110 [Nitrospirales bacterium]|nr:hypothetical protein [Nitrospira sp.]MDR4500814.1 hypothetical protein [Nitrospirales bacterium]